MKRIGTALALGVATAAVAVSPAAGQGTGTMTIAPKGKAVKTLRSQGVKIGTFGPARTRPGRLVLPVDGGLVSSTATLNQNGGLRLTRRAGGKRRRVDLKRLQLRLGGRGSEIVGYIGTSRFTLFSVKAPASRLSLSSANGTARLKGGSVALTRRAGKAIKRKLKLRRMPLGAFGGLNVNALLGGGPGGGPGGGSPGGGPGGGGPPTSGPVGDEPPFLARPASAVDVTDAQITWHARPSWIRYVPINAPFAGATGDPLTTTPACGEPNEPPHSDVYSYRFPFARGWYDPLSKTAAVYFSGAVNFQYPANGINLDFKEPEIEIAAASSRAIFRFNDRNAEKPSETDKRGVLVNLDPAGSPTPPVEGPGSVSWDRIPGEIPEAGGSQSVFANFYFPRERFGCVSMSINY